jgi:threonine dehydrogenase-like Zn-dependent dehydrogenase
MKKALAGVVVSPMRIELQEIDIPEITADSALLKVEASSICGSDWPLFAKRKLDPYIIGHENAGYIAKIGSEASRRWGVKEGDRVALEEYIPCGVCAFCRSGNFRDCKATDSKLDDSLRYGKVPISTAPGLWGGYSQYLYVSPNAVLHKIPNHIPAQVSALHLTIGNGVQWALYDGMVGIGQVVVIQGPGRQGLTCAMAAKAAGASMVIITGLSSDQNRLDFALRIGADHIINVEKENVVDKVRELTGGEMADLVIDVASGGADTIATAIKLARKRGMVVIAAAKHQLLQNFNSDEIISKHLTVKGVRGHSYQAVEHAISVMSSDKYPLLEMCTHDFNLHQLEEALHTGGRQRNLEAIQSTVLPWS